MTRPEDLAAWRLFCCNWVLLAAMTATLIVALALTGFSIEPASTIKPIAVIGAYAVYSFYNFRHPQKHDPFVVFTLGSTGQMLLIPAVMTPLTYVAASANLPMQDTALNALDQALHLDWVAYYNFFYDHHSLLTAAVWTYALIGWPIFAVPVALGWTGRYWRLQIFVLAFTIALIVTTIISIFVPAIGTYEVLNVHPDPNVFTPGGYLDQLHDLPLVRDGSLRELSYRSLTGLVTFPSFHAASAVLYLWAFWPIRRIGPLAAVVNVMMLLATPVVGGHYFVDIFAGIAIAIASIVAATYVARRMIGKVPAPILTGAMPLAAK
jgi:hypothetical protein